VRVLLAPGSFGELSAPTAAEVMAETWARAAGDAVTALPLAEGGEGLLDVVHAARGGRLALVSVPGPLGGELPAAVLTVGTTAYVEATQVVGTHLVAPGDGVADGSSEGVGRLLLAARRGGAARVVVGLGPAACCDAGAGVLRALGLDVAALGQGSHGPAGAATHDLPGLAELRRGWAACDLVAACAEDLPLDGPSGAAARGRVAAVPDGVEAVVAVVAAAARAERAAPLPGRGAGLDVAGGPGTAGAWPSPHAPRTGAGGGIAFAVAALGGRLLDGVHVVADVVGLPAAVAAADLVVTGGRRVDADELRRGVVGAVARAGLSAGVPVVAVAGDVEASRRELATAGVAAAYPLRAPPGPFGKGAAGEEDVTGARLAARTRRVAATWSPRRR
jgi:glycerate kinase